MKKVLKREEILITKKIASNMRRIRKSRMGTVKSSAKKTSVTYQTMQKYETAEIRVSPLILYNLSRMYKINIENFFNGIGIKYENEDLLDEKFIRTISNIKNPDIKKRIKKIIKSASGY